MDAECSILYGRVKFCTVPAAVILAKYHPPASIAILFTDTVNYQLPRFFYVSGRHEKGDGKDTEQQSDGKQKQSRRVMGKDERSRTSMAA